MAKKIVVNCKSTEKPGPCPTGSARGKIISTAHGDSATVVDLPDFSIGGNKKTSSHLLGDFITHLGKKGNLVHIDPKGEHITIKEKTGTTHKLSTTDDSQRNKDLAEFKATIDKLTSNSTGDVRMTKRERQELINTLVANGCGCWTDEDRDILKAFEPDRLRKLVANSLKSAKDEATLNALQEKFGVDEFTEEFIANMEVNNDDEEPVTNCGEGMEGEEMPKKKKKQVPVANTEGEEQMTEEEWLENAPPSIRAVIESAMQVNNEAKQELVAKLTANASGDKKALTQLFMGKSIAELKLLVSALPKPTVNQQQQGANRLSLAFFGGQAAGSPTTNSVLDGGEFDKDDFLPIPTINFGENN